MIVKRIFDLVAAIGILIVAWPVILVAAMLVRLKLGTPILFCQQRPGFGGKPFVLIKLRTMRDAVDSQGRTLSDEERLTKFGKILRSSSIDELPALCNVIKGDMSLVGPRPLLMEYLPLYNKRQSHRHDVKPGITGWAQVNGRNAVSWEDKFEMDVWYVENRNFWLDIKILFLTVYKVVKRDGISAPGQATQTKFIGSSPEA
jgi:lipopolysaccharide/colanic/teichoic acid biosynthesis glycosyltransferase